MLHIGLDRQVIRTIDAQREVEVRPVAQTVVRVEVVNPRPALGLPISIAADRGAPIAIERDGVFSAERSEEHTSELQSLMRISYAVFCLKKKNTTIINKNETNAQQPTTAR